MKRLVIFALVLLSATSTWGWWPRGHGMLTHAAIEALPGDFPAFMKIGVAMVAHASVDPDVAKNRGTPSLEKAVHPVHYFNAELIEGKSLPLSRYDFARMCETAGKHVEQVGLLPYILAESTDQLTLALAEYRKWPESPYIQNKCLLYAGIVAHFAQELCQPLNLTIYWNGRGADGKPKDTRIHESLDGLIQNMDLSLPDITQGLVPAASDSIMGAIGVQMAESRSHIEEALALEKYLLPRDYNYKDEAQVQKFAMQQARSAANFTAGLYLTAWEKSASVRLPGWIDRAEMDLIGTGN